MPRYAWQCIVCEASNTSSTDFCQLCAAPVRLTKKEIESRRAQWESADNTHPVDSQSLGLASKLALLLVANVVAVSVFMHLAISGGGNPIGAGMVGSFLMLPVPFLAVAWIAVCIRNLIK